MGQQGNNALVPQGLDVLTLDLVEKIRAKGFGPREITFMTMKADVENNCRNRKEFQAKLKSLYGIEMSYDEIARLERDPQFQECVNWLFTIEQGDMIRAVKKNLYRRAADPRDPHAIAAARLVLQMHGELGKGKAGEGSTDGGTYADFIHEFREAQKEGRKVTLRERTVTIGDGAETPLLPESGTRSRKVVQGNFQTPTEREDPSSEEAAVAAPGDPED